MIHNVRRPMTVGYISEKIKSRVMASGLSAESQLKTVFAAIFSIVMGYVSDIFGIGVGLMAVGCTVLALLPFIRVKD